MSRRKLEITKIYVLLNVMATVTLTPPLYTKRNQKVALRQNPEWLKIVEKSLAIATYYIPYHLRNSFKQESLRGLPKHFLIPPNQPPELFKFVEKLCTQLLENNSSFFSGLPGKVGLKVENAKTVFFSLCKETFADKVINWGRVITVFALAGLFAAHFVSKGQLSTVVKIPVWVQEFVDQELVDWIAEQGGWEDLQNKLSGDKECLPTWTHAIAFGSVAVAAGYLLLASGLGK